jgi:CubicO group peptidase (beta-lactamase class C family)
MLFEPDMHAEGFVPRGDAYQLGLAPSALDDLLRDAEFTESEALIIVKGGRVVVERYFGHNNGLVELMSLTKSIVSLIIGCLIAEGTICSVDVPLFTWYPEWREGLKSEVTLRHILTHTSGLEHSVITATMAAQAANRVEYTRALRVVKKPGSEFSYNNEATQLLSGIVNIAAGMPLDVYVKKKLFDPLGISIWSWEKDRAGNVQASYGLSLSARDVARIGLLVLNEGRWNRETLVPADWIRQSTSPGHAITQFYGFLWYLRSGSPSNRAHGFYGNGWLGQHLIIYPEWDLVAVRLHRVMAGGGEVENERYGFASFFDRIEAAVVVR